MRWVSINGDDDCSVDAKNEDASYEIAWLKTDEG